jgi:succinoglycan biosynthesis transport protein ExoP
MSSISNKSFDVTAFVSNALRYVHHGRLMTVMGCLGILAGLVYYVYATPIYESKALVYVRGHGSPVQLSTVPETIEASGLNRAIIQEFSSRRNIIETAKRLGLVGVAATWENVVEIVPFISVAESNSSHLEVTVQARSPEVVRVFAAALVEEFRRQQDLTWQQYRDEALDRYARELKALQEKANANLKQLATLEREEKMAESAIEQTRLNELPKDLIVTREVLQRMDEVNTTLAALAPGREGERELPDVLQELSLLTTFEKEREIKIGDVVRRAVSGAGAPLVSAPPANVAAEVIVQPNMVESLQPWQKLEKERRILEDRKIELAKQYLPGHSIMKKVAEELEANERGLRSELTVLRQRFHLEREHYRMKLATLQGRLVDYHKVNEEFTQNTQTYSDIEKEKTLWDKARDHLAEKLAVVTFSEDRNWVEMHFKGHTAMRDEVPVSPNKSKLLIFSVVLALGGAFGAPTLVNLMDSSASTLQQLENVTGLKGIGVVPHTSKEMLEDVCRSPALGAKVPNFLLENFRLVRSHITLSPGRSGSTQVVMVTSARASEGKTSQAANLAWAFQSMGARTLLIDCDLRRGRVHNFTKVLNDLGMTHLLQGHCSIEEAIQKTAVPLLDVIPRGPITVGTTDLMAQPVFFNLVQKLRGQYDQIVIDSPPVLGLSETSSFQRTIDGVVFVARAEKTSLKDVVDAVTLLRKAGAHIFGLVLNDLDLSRVSNYYNYYYYSATYYDDMESAATEYIETKSGKFKHCA